MTEATHIVVRINGRWHVVRMGSVGASRCTEIRRIFPLLRKPPIIITDYYVLKFYEILKARASFRLQITHLPAPKIRSSVANDIIKQ